MSNIAPIDDLKNNINKMAPQFKMALPPHVSVEKFVRTMITAIQTVPALVKANRASLYAAAMKAASAGLLPDGKEAALIPFKDEVQYIPMTAGILKQIRNSDELGMITANLIFKGDHFRYWVDANGEHIEHEPLLFGDRGEQLGVYALAKLKDGSIYIEVLNMKQIEDIRNVSRAKNGPAWSGPFRPEMEKKSAIRRLSKRLPISTDRQALDSENDDFDFRDVKHAPEMPTEAIEAPAKEAKPKRQSRLAQAIEGQSEPMDMAAPPEEFVTEAAQAEPPPKKEVKNYAPGAGAQPKYDERDEDPNFSTEV